MGTGQLLPVLVFGFVILERRHLVRFEFFMYRFTANGCTALCHDTARRCRAFYRATACGGTTRGWTRRRTTRGWTRAARCGGAARALSTSRARRRRCRGRGTLCCHVRCSKQ